MAPCSACRSYAGMGLRDRPLRSSDELEVGRRSCRLNRSFSHRGFPMPGWPSRPGRYSSIPMRPSTSEVETSGACRPMPANHRLPVQRRLIMFEKFGRFAETLATSAGQSRRGFLGRLGKGAMGVAGLVGGVFLFPREAYAFRGCGYDCPRCGFTIRACPPPGTPCPGTIKCRGVKCILVARDCG
jgi:hypothetical protein